MSDIFIQRIAALKEAKLFEKLGQCQFGLEKESLRADRQGTIAQTPHPKSVGSALTHPYITTDYSEALPEFITPPFDSAEKARDFLRDLQVFFYQKIGDEMLWPTSMPCVVNGEQSVKIADYGSSNLGMMKTIYRRGLAHRYGRVMQVIAGVHFNFSFPESFWPEYQTIQSNSDQTQYFINESYFGLLRNIQRNGWLIPYLFGASPAVCKSFLTGKPSSLAEYDAFTLYEPDGTSLRMGDIGYQNNKENETGVKANYDSCGDYVESLRCAINRPCPLYEKTGVKVDGEYLQLNANILQIENEYYSTVRPKQILEGLEKPTDALERRGVKYVELRSLDINLFDPVGVSLQQLHFLHVFMIYCLVQESPTIDVQERKEIDANEMLAAHRGRKPGIRLQRQGEMVTLHHWAHELFDQMALISSELDRANQTKVYSEALTAQREKVDNPELTPSAMTLSRMRQQQQGFYEFAYEMALKHESYLKSMTLDASRQQEFETLAHESLARQQQIENEQTQDFDEFLQDYLASGA